MADEIDEIISFVNKMRVPGGRGSGRTYRALETAPPNTLFLVHHSAMIPYVKGLCNKLGRLDIRVASVQTAVPEAIRGTDWPIRFDHNVWDCAWKVDKFKLLMDVQKQRGA